MKKVLVALLERAIRAGVEAAAPGDGAPPSKWS